MDIECDIFGSLLAALYETGVKGQSEVWICECGKYLFPSKLYQPGKRPLLQPHAGHEPWQSGIRMSKTCSHLKLAQIQRAMEGVNAPVLG